MERFLTIEDLGNLPEPKWLIDGLFEQDALVMLVGPPGSFKSFLAIDWALSLAAGRMWNERPTKPTKVLYALGEGKASLLKRIKAWACHNGLCREEKEQVIYEPALNANFRVTFDVPQLASQKDTTRFMDELDRDGFNPSLLIIDTLARSYVGKNENDPMDVGVWVESVDRLRQKGMTVLVLHHTRKNQEFGLQFRGSTAFSGAMDTIFMLARNPEGFRGYAKLKCEKQKDHIEAPDIWLSHKHISPNKNEEGSIVLIETEKPAEEEEMMRDEEEKAITELITSLVADNNFKSDRARARELANKTGILESTASSKIHRARKSGKQELPTGA